MATTIELFANNAQSTLAGAISNVVISLNVASGAGALFPSPNNSLGQFFRLSLTDAATGLLHEIMYVTARSADTFTVIRAQEGTTAQSWQAGDIAANMNTAGAMANMVQGAQAQAGTSVYSATDTGTAGSYAIALTPAMPTATDGARLRFKAANANPGASTLTVNGGTSYPLVGLAGAALQSGEIFATGICECVFDSSLGAAPGSYVLQSCTSAALQVGTATQSRQAAQLGQLPSVVGTARNVLMVVSAASATATLTADEIVLENTLAGNPIRLGAFNQNINLATTGAGGMDTGAAPAGGYVALYAICNITGSTRALLAVNATSGVATEVYSGANMPGGYIYSALLGVWPTTAGGQFPIGAQVGRWFNRSAQAIINTSSTQASFASLTIANAVPRNAKRAKCLLSAINTTVNTVQTVNLATDINGSGQQSLTTGIVLAGNGNQSTGIVDIATPQTVYYSLLNNGGGTPTFNASISGYEI